MVISINTEKMNELSNLAMSISSELSEACVCLSPITAHNDWNCAERDNINEAILTNKKCAGDLINFAESFSSAVTKAATAFTDLEKKNPQALLDLQAILSESFSVYTPSSVGHVSSYNWNGTPSHLNPLIELDLSNESLNPYLLYPLTTWDKPIKMIKYY